MTFSVTYFFLLIVTYELKNSYSRMIYIFRVDCYNELDELNIMLMNNQTSTVDLYG